MRKFLTVSAILAIVWSLFQLYTAAFGAFPAIIQRSVHVAFALSLAFSIKGLSKEKEGLTRKIIDWITIVTPLIIGAYIIFHADRISSRMLFIDSVESLDFWFGVVFTILLFEITRRIIGNFMVILAALFVVYGFIGPYLGGLIGHRGISVDKMVEMLFLSQDGIFGVPVGVAETYVFYFILFGAFLSVSGGGKLFIDLAFKLTRKSKGGPAKASIVASGLMGSISGSAVGNVVTTGIFTIPLMKKSGYTSKDAGAVEALASTGGQIMPPIMGAGAFILAEMVGIPYTKVIVAALVPALLFYIALLIFVHIKALQDGIQPIELEEQKENILKRIHLLLPLVILVSLMFILNTSLQMAAFWTIVSIILVSFFRKDTRFKVINIFEALEQGAKQAVNVTIPCAIAGIIVGIIGFSGLGVKFTSLIIEWSFGITILSLIMVAIGCIILGMGLPTTSAYIMAAILLAPALQELGFAPLAAHLFIFYFAVLSMVTPPIALASYAAAGISGASMNSTSIRALIIGLPGFLIPFSFILNPALILQQGTILEIILVILFSLLGITTLSMATIGYMFMNMKSLLRSVLFIASVMLIIPSFVLSIMGVVLVILVASIQFFNSKKVMTKSNFPALDKGS